MFVIYNCWNYSLNGDTMILSLIGLLVLVSIYIAAVDAAKHYIVKNEIPHGSVKLYSTPENAKVSDRRIYLADSEHLEEIKGFYLLVVAYVLWRTK